MRCCEICDTWRRPSVLTAHERTASRYLPVLGRPRLLSNACMRMNTIIFVVMHIWPTEAWNAVTFCRHNLFFFDGYRNVNLFGVPVICTLRSDRCTYWRNNMVATIVGGYLITSCSKLSLWSLLELKNKMSRKTTSIIATIFSDFVIVM